MVLLVQGPRFDVSGAHEYLPLGAYKLNKTGSTATGGGGVILWPSDGILAGGRCGDGVSVSPGRGRRRDSQEPEGGLASQIGFDAMTDSAKWKARIVVGAAA